MSNLPEESQKPKKITIRNIFYHNTFVLIFSFVCAITIWFTMAANSTLNRPHKITGIPVNIQLTEAAQEEGIRVFSQSLKEATVSITGNTLILNKVSPSDIAVTARLSPLASKLSGNTMYTETLLLSAVKQGEFSDYEIKSVEPEEISVTYDRYKEATFTIENNMKYTTTQNHHVSTPVMSETQVVVSGPQSAVNKISRVSLDYEIADPVTESKSFTAQLTVYDQNNKPMKLEDQYLSLSTSTVDVNLNVRSKQTVALEVTTQNMPEGFSASRITIEPASIDIAGDFDTVSKYKSIVLATPIDFTKVNTKNNTFEMEIPMPAGVLNVSQVEKAKVTVNLNAFSEAAITTEQITIVNQPEDKNVSLVTKSLLVNVVGSTAQVGRLKADSIFVTVDMTNLADKNGTIEVPAKVVISGATSCWVYEQYSIHVNVEDKAVNAMEPLSDPLAEPTTPPA